MYFITYQLLFPVVPCYLYIINYKPLLVVPGSTPPLPADESLQQYVEDGSMYSSIRDPRKILWYILLGPHHDQLATFRLSRREMAARDTHFMCPSKR